jgi:putative tryptophan/tyrosine transport system substrate-binding protein
MRRREFITLVSCAASLLEPIPVARAQAVGRRYRVAVLVVTPRVGSPPLQAFLDELGRGGFAEGRNLEVDGHGFGVAPASFDAAAIELVRSRPDVILAVGPEAAHAVQRATRSIAIVAMADDLVASGLVTSMPHPEGYCTGVAFFAFQLNVKRLEILYEALPETRRMGILADRDPIPSLLALDGAARDLGIEIVPLAARSKEEIVQAIDAMKARSVDAVNVLASPILWAFRSLILERLRVSRLPAIWQWPEGAEQGGLIGYGPRDDAVFRQCALQVAKLLRGAMVADVPVEQPTKFELVINAKTARALGITIPPLILARADQVIE